MQDFNSVWAAAQQLPTQDRLRLIDALWDTVTPGEEAAFSPEWAVEIERRVAEMQQGTAKMIPWSTVRDEALARIGHGKTS